ncbi:glycosyltransferase family 1 protein [Candidatus Nomurabacteria bacterium]|nr:glycosyltransferase family 1 protein [Candidatus Nomurabacteria bacterium]
MDKLLIITDSWDPKIDGIVTTLKKTKEILEGKGLKVIIIHPELFTAIPLFFYPEIKLSLFSSKKIRKIIRTEKPDYIHIATEGPLGISARSICVKNKIPFTTAYHTHFPLYAKVRIKFLYHIVYSYLRWFHKKAAATIVSSESLRRELMDHKFKNLLVVPFGVDLDLFVRNKETKVPKLPGPVFVYFGRIAIEKNLEVFLSCKFPGTKLIIGDGPDRNMLENKYGGNNLFVGYKNGKNLVDYLSICDVLVFPSLTETFGLVILEAFSCGIPVAAYDVMGPKDLITHGVDGYLGNDLLDSALKCLDLSPLDCRKKASSYSWEAYADSFIKNQVKIN